MYSNCVATAKVDDPTFATARKNLCNFIETYNIGSRATIAK